MLATASIQPNPQITGWYINSKWCDVGVVRVRCHARCWKSSHPRRPSGIPPMSQQGLRWCHLCWWWCSTIRCLGGGYTQIFFMFNPKIGEDEPILTIIFFKGVGSTTNQRCVFARHCVFSFQIFYVGAWGMFIPVPHPVCFFMLFARDVGQLFERYALCVIPWLTYSYSDIQVWWQYPVIWGHVLQPGWEFCLVQLGAVNHTA